MLLGMHSKKSLSNTIENKPARKRYSDEERVKHVRAWQSSGLSGLEYARKNGLHSKSMYAWRAKFAEQLSGNTNASKEDAVPVQPTFVSLSVPATPTPSSPKVSLRMGQLELKVESCTSHRELVALVAALKKEVADV